MKIIILGSGLAGLSTAYHLRLNSIDYEVFEKETQVGGLCKSIKFKGFIFDYGGHFLHINNEYTKKLLFDNFKLNLKKIERRAMIYYKNVFTPYPFQYNLHDLPIDVKIDCILGIIKAKCPKEEKTSTNFKEWIQHNLGEGIGKHFMFPYNEKLWSFPLEKISIDWIEKFVPNPSIKDLIEGALEKREDKKIGYNAFFYYPVLGGIDSIPKAFRDRVENIHLKNEIKSIDIKKKEILTSDSKIISYDYLVNTIPLTKFINIIKNGPRLIYKKSIDLNYTNLFVLNFGIINDLNKSLIDKHWIYYPEKKFIFHRIIITSNIVEKMAPEGMSSISLEISYSKFKVININEICTKAINNLKELGLIKSKIDIQMKSIVNISPSYVIYDHNREKNVNYIKELLFKNNIFTIGRYGNWEYSSMENAILQGRNIAKIISNFN